MPHRNVGVTLGIVSLLVAGAARAAEGEAAAPETAAPAASQGILPIPSYTGDLFAREHLAGDFNGGRTGLASIRSTRISRSSAAN